MVVYDRTRRTGYRPPDTFGRQPTVIVKRTNGQPVSIMPVLGGRMPMETALPTATPPAQSAPPVATAATTSSLEDTISNWLQAQTIPGVPNTLLILGAGLLGIYLYSKRK